jgi:hypothetical protein
LPGDADDNVACGLLIIGISCLIDRALSGMFRGR